MKTLLTVMTLLCAAGAEAKTAPKSSSSSKSSSKEKACMPKGGACKFRSDCCSGPCKANYRCGG